MKYVIDSDTLTGIADAIRHKTDTPADIRCSQFADQIEGIQTGITPSGSITLTEERSYDVTDKATAVVDMSATRANLAEAVTAKGVDTLPTSSFDTIATNIGLISGGGGLPQGVSEFNSGDVTLDRDYTDYSGSGRLTIPHSLNSTPNFVAVVMVGDADDTTGYRRGSTFYSALNAEYPFSYGDYLSGGSFSPNPYYNVATSLEVDTTNIYVNASYTFKFKQGTKLRWFAIRIN